MKFNKMLLSLLALVILSVPCFANNGAYCVDTPEPAEKIAQSGDWLIASFMGITGMFFPPNSTVFTKKEGPYV